MSLDDTENIVEKKLMGILEEELSALKLMEVEKNNENIFTNNNDSEENADKKTFSSSSDTTVELVKETSSNENEVEYTVSEALIPVNENAAEEIQRPIKYQYHGRELTHQNEMVHLENEKSAEMSEAKMRDNRHNKTFTNDAEEKFTPPSDSLREKVKQRVERYFEDYNLFKNSFLLSHIRRNKMGYVSLKLVTSLRKMKSVTRDSRVVAYSLRNSEVLELNPENNKIRRIEPIPNTEDTSFGKTLMVFNLPLQNFSRDSLKEMFSKFGTVISAGIYEIDSPESDIYHERCLQFHRKIASKIYGIVEFEKYDEVVKALKDEESHLPKENEVKAVPLLPQIYKKEKRHLKFLNWYNPNQKRGYNRYRPRNDYIVKSEAASSGDIRNETMRGGYGYNRGYFRRSYRRNPYLPSNSKNFGNDYIPRVGNKPHRGLPKKWGENRQLRANNSFNIERMYPNVHRKKAGNGYMSSEVPS